MVIKRNNKSEVAEPDAHSQEVEGGKQQPAAGLAYRRKVNEATFEWSKDPLPDLTAEEIRAVQALKLSTRSARVIKRMMQDGFRYKQILFHLRGKNGFSKSSVSKLHAALVRVNKQNLK